MKWEKFISGIYTGGYDVEVRSLRCRDEAGNWRRYRVCSGDGEDRFTRRPAKGRLVKEPGGKIGVVIRPGGTGFVKVGKRLALQPSVFAPVGAISKRPRQKLLKQVSCTLYEYDGLLEAWEE